MRFHLLRRPRRMLSPLWRAARVAGAILLGLLALSAVLVCAVVLYARTDAGREHLRQLVLVQARAQVPGLRIGHIGGDYVHALSLDDVNIVDASGRTVVHVGQL